jgi:hypothetical protein
MHRIAPILCLFCLVSCQSDKRPEGILEETPFVRVYCDLLLESQRSRNSGADPSTAQANAAAVLEHAGISKEAYESTYLWYNEDITRWKTFMEEAMRELERRESPPTPPPAQPASPHPALAP